eukprot:scpid59275/ scgid30300/ 
MKPVLGATCGARRLRPAVADVVPTSSAELCGETTCSPSLLSSACEYNGQDYCIAERKQFRLNAYELPVPISGCKLSIPRFDYHHFNPARTSTSTYHYCFDGVLLRVERQETSLFTRPGKRTNREIVEINQNFQELAVFPQILVLVWRVNSCRSQITSWL